MKKKIVISLGGSLIVPKEIDYIFLKKFRSLIRKNYSKYKFIVVCGGGSVARKYITALKKEGKNQKEISLAGIRVTRMNARFMMQFFGKEANENLPRSMKEVENLLSKNKIVFCGALRYSSKETSDGTAAKLANYLNTDFINITNVSGLYSSNPAKNKKAKFIPYTSWKDFEKRALDIKFRPGQHFVLDQKAASQIKKNKIKTYIIGKNLKNLDNILNNKKFTGTLIEGD